MDSGRWTSPPHRPGLAPALGLRRTGHAGPAWDLAPSALPCALRCNRPLDASQFGQPAPDRHTEVSYVSPTLRCTPGNEPACTAPGGRTALSARSGTEGRSRGTSLHPFDAGAGLSGSPMAIASGSTW